MKTILHGASCSGKTSLFNKLKAANPGAEFITSEAFFNPLDKEPNLKELHERINSSQNALIDGYPFWINGFQELEGPLKHIVVFSPEYFIHNRQKRKQTFQESAKTREIYEKILEFANFKDLEFYYNLDDFEKKEFESPEAFWEFYNQESRKPYDWEEIEFCQQYWAKSLQSGDLCYQDYARIELPNVWLPGASPWMETWNAMSNLIDFRHRKVVEFGCHYGHYLFKALEIGSRSALGLEANAETVEVCKRLRFLKQLDARFKTFNLGIDDFEEKRDITICCNMLHYVKPEDLQKALKTLFSNTHKVFFEVKQEQRYAVCQFAYNAGFEIIFEASSRDNRRMLYFK